jgi:hypothetical protein
MLEPTVHELFGMLNFVLGHPLRTFDAAARDGR